MGDGEGCDGKLMKRVSLFSEKSVTGSRKAFYTEVRGSDREHREANSTTCLQVLNDVGSPQSL
jgi:hypothetical protein